MKKVLVTGAAGFIGSVLVAKLLSEGYFVTAVDNLMYDQTSLLGYINNPAFSFHKVDVRDEIDMPPLYKKADVIIPLAGIVGAPACAKAFSDSWKINTDCVTDLSYWQDKLIIYPNTNSGYGTKSGVKHCTEETPLEPISDYGRQKVAAEKRLFEHHPRTISLRLATVFGASSRMRWDLLVNGLVYDAMRYGHVVLYEPHAKRNYIHIKDVVSCMLFCIDNHDKMIGQAYNLGLDKANLSKYELAEIVQYMTNCEVFLSPRRIDPDKRNYVVSNKKLKKAGYSAIYSIEDGIEDLQIAYQMMPKKEVWRNV